MTAIDWALQELTWNTSSPSTASTEGSPGLLRAPTEARSSAVVRRRRAPRTRSGCKTCRYMSTLHHSIQTSLIDDKDYGVYAATKQSQYVATVQSQTSNATTIQCGDSLRYNHNFHSCKAQHQRSEHSVIFKYAQLRISRDYLYRASGSGLCSR